MTGRAERGGGSVLTLASALALIMVALTGMWIAAWSGDTSRAQGLADLVAVQAAEAHAAGADACQEADAVAKANSGQLDSCEVDSGYGEFIVSVSILIRLNPSLPGGPDQIKASAKAGILTGQA